MMHRGLWILTACALVLWGCSDDEESSGGGAGVGGACAESLAGQPCEDDCFFAPLQVDCSAACQRIADLCAAGTCGTLCTGLNQDVNLCSLACQGTRASYCTNETFGCWASETTCDGIGTCFSDAVDRRIALGGGGGDTTRESATDGGGQGPGASGARSASGGGAGAEATDTASPPPDDYCSRRGSAVAPRPEGGDAERPGPSVAFRCPADCQSKTATILWGTDIYTDDSHVCIAAIHAGAITNEAGGTVRLRWMPGQESYPGSERNGITSSSWGSWSNSFEFVR